jgi:hypothetical protein
VDLHSAGVPSDTVDWTLCVEDDTTGDAMANAYGSPYVCVHRLGGGEGVDPGLLDGALFVRLSRAGLPSILIEGGGGLSPPGREVAVGDLLARVVDGAYEIGW